MAKVLILSFSPSKDLFFFVCVVINYIILGFLFFFFFNSGFYMVKSKVKISLLCVFFFS